MARKNKNINSTEDLTEKDLESQEHLSNSRLTKILPKSKTYDLNRPKANLIDLMHWAKEQYGSELAGDSEVECWIHNKIVIDGSFMHFCEENEITISCLLKDSMASWKSEHGFEHFMAQGIFKISKDNLTFLHCALFHKGNQNEDEVSFFILVRHDDYDKYVELRNKFDKWLISRDRNHLEVHVVGGEGYSYTRDSSWDDLFLPDQLKKDIRSSIEGFLGAKRIYEKNNVPWRRGLLFWGEPGNGKTSCIKTIMSQYNFKPVTVQSGSQTNDDTITEAFAYAQEQKPGLLFIEDLDTLLSHYVSLSHFLQMMDGVSSKNGILIIATANDINALKESVKDRPSRFDRKWEFPLPDEKLSRKYLEQRFGDMLSDSDYKKIIKKTVEKKFSYAYLKELYLTSVFNALADNREIPNLNDVNQAVKQLLSDKDAALNGFEKASDEKIGIHISSDDEEDF